VDRRVRGTRERLAVHRKRYLVSKPQEGDNAVLERVFGVGVDRGNGIKSLSGSEF